MRYLKLPYICTIIKNKTIEIMTRFNEPIRTDILWNNQDDSSITIIGETEKAILIVVGYNKKRGTSMVSDRITFEKWIPKSVWNNEKNFETTKFKGCGDLTRYFKVPYFLK